VADPATVFFAQRVLVRPVHEATVLIPFVDAAKCDPVTQADWHAQREFEVVRDQQSLAPGQLHYEALVPGAIVIVRDQSHHEARVLDPAIVIPLVVARLYGRVTRP
jgi:hypothetical protein